MTSLHPAHQLAQMMTRIYTEGLTTLSGGNLSIRDSDGSLWITPSGVDKGRLTPDDIIHVLTDGTLDGPHRASSELPFHRAIYAQRPDLYAIVHAHAPALVSFSLVRRLPDVRITAQMQQLCGTIGYVSYALPGSETLGQQIASAFAQGSNAVLLENHGAVTAGATLLEAFQRLEAFDSGARAQLFAQSLGTIRTLTEDQLALVTHHDLLPETAPNAVSDFEHDLRCRLSDQVQRACRRHLMSSTQGEASVRVNAGSFLITPRDSDLPHLTGDELVLITDGQREPGKYPSQSAALHAAIYQRHPHVQCILSSQAPYILAYALSDRTMDTRTIPESYIMLLDVPTLSFDGQYTAPETVAERIGPQTPVILLENQGVLTTGSTLMQAYDRLEVAEFTARSLIETASIGALVTIGAREIEDLKRAFAHLMTC